MRYRRLAPARPLESEPAIGPATHERLMLLELAGDLQSWPARNAVFKKALDHAAQELARMASETAAH